MSRVERQKTRSPVDRLTVGSGEVEVRMVAPTATTFASKCSMASSFLWQAVVVGTKREQVKQGRINPLAYAGFRRELVLKSICLAFVDRATPVQVAAPILDHMYKLMQKDVVVLTEHKAAHEVDGVACCHGVGSAAVLVRRRGTKKLDVFLIFLQDPRHNAADIVIGILTDPRKQCLGAVVNRSCMGGECGHADGKHSAQDA